jgi:hypothetical protein
MEHQIDATKVIARLSNQLSSMQVELATKDVLVQELETELERLRALVDEKVSVVGGNQELAEEVSGNGKQERKAAAKG